MKQIWKQRLRRVPMLVPTYRHVRFLWRYWRSGSLVKNYLESHAVRKLQIGCGGNLLEGWPNTDLDPLAGAAFLDARKTLPFVDRTFDYIFTEHCIEHLKFSEGIRLLQECNRVLKPGGTLRIATPNLRFLIELYAENKTASQERYIRWTVETECPELGSSVKRLRSTDGLSLDTLVVNNFFRAWGHQFIYDRKLLAAVLRSCGFAQIRHCQPGQSEEENLRGLESHGLHISQEFNTLESMVVEATTAISK